MEPHTFSQIKLTASRLKAFDKIVTHQRQNYVHYLWFSLELEEYPCHDCGSDESDDESDDESNNEIDETDETDETDEIDEIDEGEKTGTIGEADEIIDGHGKNEAAKKNEGYDTDEGYETDDVLEYGNSDTEDPFVTRKKECTFIGKAFFQLFKVLNSWPSKGELVLDISAHSPSDNKHGFKYLTFEPDWQNDNLDQSCLQGRLMREDSQNIEEPGCETPIPGHHVLHKLFSDIHERDPSPANLGERWWFRLPRAPAVTSMMLRQQNRRRWNPEILTHLASLCPRLKDFTYEPWREWENDVQVTQTDPGKIQHFLAFHSSCH